MFSWGHFYIIIDLNKWICLFPKGALSSQVKDQTKFQLLLMTKYWTSHLGRLTDTCISP